MTTRQAVHRLKIHSNENGEPRVKQTHTRPRPVRLAACLTVSIVALAGCQPAPTQAGKDQGNAPALEPGLQAGARADAAPRAQRTIRRSTSVF